MKCPRVPSDLLLCVYCKLEFLLWLACQRFPTSICSTLAKSHFCLFSATLANVINLVEKELAFPKISLNVSLPCTLLQQTENNHPHCRDHVTQQQEEDIIYYKTRNKITWWLLRLYLSSTRRKEQSLVIFIFCIILCNAEEQ